MKKFFAMYVVSAFLLAACGGDTGSNADSDEPVSSSAVQKSSSKGDSAKSSSSKKDSSKSSSSKAKSSSSTKKSSSSAKSSSSKKTESSSSVQSSSSATSGSSEALHKGCKTATEDNCEYGELVDDRDGQTYKTVKIGNQWWMAENLNYKREAKYKDDYCYCYDNSEANCDKYGRLYVWSSAEDACPAGWHLPDATEWRTLFDEVGGEKVAGIALKTTSGWNHSGEATDAFGFSVRPAGFRDWLIQNRYYEVGYQAWFWSSSDLDSRNAYCAYFDSGNNSVIFGHEGSDYGYSVRCVKDAEPEIRKPSVTVPTAKACKTETKDECEYGSLTDSRDKKTYKTVKIDKQWWMAENLNLETPNSYCYNDSSKYCIKYGRLYTWAAAMDSTAKWSSNGKGCGDGKICTPTYPVRGVCPDGWHLPTRAEIESLIIAAGGEDVAGSKLKSANGGWESYWSSDEDEWKNGNGTDDYSFSALPTGFRIDFQMGSVYHNEGSLAHFWSSSEKPDDDGSDYAYSLYLTNDNFVDPYPRPKFYGLSVRCVQD